MTEKEVLQATFTLLGYQNQSEIAGCPYLSLRLLSPGLETAESLQSPGKELPTNVAPSMEFFRWLCFSMSQDGTHLTVLQQDGHIDSEPKHTEDSYNQK